MVPYPFVDFLFVSGLETMAEEELMFDSKSDLGDGDFDKLNDTSDMGFCMANYPKNILKMMGMMRNHQMLTDIVLEVGNQEFYAHKVMLAAASPYFKAMFTGGLKETQMSHVRLQDSCPSAVEQLLSFIYTGHIRITENTVCQLLPPATMYQVTDVVKACCMFLERQLCPVNALGIAAFAEQHGCQELYSKAYSYVLLNFSEVSQEEEFLQISMVDVLDLIKKDELHVKDERDVYNAVLKWVKYKEDERRPQMHAILSAVRCQFLTPSFLNDQMKNCDVIKKLPACREYLAQIFKDLTLHKNSIVKERTPRAPRMIYVAGGYLRQSLDTLEAFNVDEGTWTSLSKLTIPRSGLGGAFLRGLLYAVGGRNSAPGSSTDSDWVDRYDPSRDLWRPCNPMSVPRNRVGVGIVDGLLYAVGGAAGVECHDTVERYDPDDDRWSNVKPMHTKRLGVGIAVVNRLLYAIGGFDGEERLKTCECYLPEEDSWKLIAEMQVPRSGAGVAAINHSIYIVGGYNNQQLDSVEVYNTETDVWSFAASLPSARSALSVVVIDKKLYALGGFDGQGYVATVDVYDPVKNEWKPGTPMPSERSGHMSVVSFQQTVVANP